MERKSKLNYLVRIALLSAVAAVLMLIKLPLAIFPEWLTIDISDVPAVIGALIMGPLAGVAIEGVKILLNLLFNGSFTGGVGELANFVIGIALVVPVGLVFKYKKTARSALLGCLFGVVTMTITGVTINYFVMVPLFAKLYGIEPVGFAEAAMILPVTGQFIKGYLDFILVIFVPFNIFKGLLVTLATQSIYKFVVPPLLNE